MLFFGASAVSGVQINSNPQPLNRGWLYVGGIGPGNHTRIQDAIDNASDGDTVFVYNGTYKEHVFIYKEITLQGESKDNTIIDGCGGAYDVVHVYKNTYNVTVKGFTIGNTLNKGIFIDYGKDVVIEDNIIKDCRFGIYTWHSTMIIIRSNIVTKNEWGIHVELTDHCTIEYNHVINNSELGIILYVSFIGNIIRANVIEKNERYGLVLGRSSGNRIEYNDFIDNGNEAGTKLEKRFRQASFKNCLNRWNDNYWSDRLQNPVLTVYAIFGIFKSDFYPALQIPWIQFDLRANPNPNNPPIPKI